MFYDIFCELCREKGVAPTRAALDIGLSKSTPSAWKKRGLTPQGDALNRIANYFDVPLGRLLGNAKQGNAVPKNSKPSSSDIKAAFWGGDKNLSEADLDELWQDVQEYARFKAEQKKKKDR